MNTENLYINDEQFFRYCEENGLLDDTQIEVLKLATVNVDHIFLDYFVPSVELDRVINECRIKQSQYAATGSIAQVECYSEFIQMLSSMWRVPEGE